MQINRVVAVFFSATGRTEKALFAFTDALPLSAEKLDLTDYAGEDEKRIFGPEDLVVFAAPVYGGRIPAPAAERFKNMQGSHTPAVCLAVYGNRDYDDALLEMTDLVRVNGFVPVAAAALLAEHSIMRSVAAGRPDEQDKEKTRAFAKQLWQELMVLKDISAASELQIKGQKPFKTFNGVPFKPTAGKECTRCGTCAARCPVQAIPARSPEQTDKEKCISCMRCIGVCPVHARKLNKLALAVAEKIFAFKCAARKEPEFFL